MIHIMLLVWAWVRPNSKECLYTGLGLAMMLHPIPHAELHIGHATVRACWQYGHSGRTQGWQGVGKRVLWLLDTSKSPRHSWRAVVGKAGSMGSTAGGDNGQVASILRYIYIYFFFNRIPLFSFFRPLLSTPTHFLLSFFNNYHPMNVTRKTYIHRRADLWNGQCGGQEKFW